jgi:alpha-amylase/alpha-mannosidase (GH57 family)
VTSPRYVCIHGHFYQPPRENPWLEAVEHQSSARPYHDWNERITAECYAPNTAARILDSHGRVADLISTYRRISYNVGPTLLSWMEREEPEVYRSIIQADARGRERIGGAGPAMAQCYNHLIMPLANARDRETQVRWGIRDFEHRFGRRPEGMWLPETAVDTASLEALAAQGIRFTILAPYQARSVRPPDGEWRKVTNGSPDTTRPYRVSLPSGATITVFFYDGSLSQEVAFDGVLRDGQRFADRLMGAARRGDSEAPLVHLATDGETYGHHHRHGEMALAYALRAVERSDDIELISYGAYLDRHPPSWEARIHEDTSWSCAHGVERWRSDCGCRIGRGTDWIQTWRAPLRAALDWLRDELAGPFEAEAGRIFDDPWEARNRYIDVILDRSDPSLDHFFQETAGAGLEDADRIRGLRLMELQRNLLLMYTSCGWFFDEISDIETTQVLRYAGRVIHLTSELLGEEAGQRLEVELENRLREAPSNRPELGHGARVYRDTVDESRIDLSKAAAHYAVSSIFDPYPDETRIYCYHYEKEDQELHGSGSAKLLVGRVRVTSDITRNHKRVTYAVLHLGDQNLVGGIRTLRNGEAYAALQTELEDAFRQSELTGVLRILDREFEASTYSLRSLFQDAQLRIVDTMLEEATLEVEEHYEEIYQDTGPLLRFLADLKIPVPRPFGLAAEYVLNQRIRRSLDQDPVRIPAVRSSVEAAIRSGIHLDQENISFAAETALEWMVRGLRVGPGDHEDLARIRELARLFARAGVTLDLWKVQNEFWRYGQAVAAREGDGPEAGETGEAGESGREAWRTELEAVADALRVELPS